MCSQKGPDRFGRIAAAAKPFDRRQARVVPPGHLLVLHELQQFPLAHDRVADVQAGELDLLRTVGCTGPFDNPVIERPMVLKFQGANRMCHAFDRIGKGMGKVIGRVDAPCLACPIVGSMPDSIQHRIAQIDVRRRHVDLGSQHVRAVWKFARAHPTQKIEILVYGAVAVGAVLSRFGQRASIAVAFRRR